MKMQVTVFLDVTPLNEDGSAAPAPKPGDQEHQDLVESAGNAIYNSVKRGVGSEAAGFRHELSRRTSVVVTRVTEGSPIPPPIRRHHNAMTMIATREMVEVAVQMLADLESPEIPYFVNEVMDQLRNIHAKTRTALIDQAIDHLHGIDRYAAQQWFEPGEEA